MRVSSISSGFAGRTRALRGRREGVNSRMAETSEAMIVAARKAQEGSSLAKNASSEASANVSSVATASEQLLESIEAINRQVIESTSVVKRAVAETQSALVLLLFGSACLTITLEFKHVRRVLFLGVSENSRKSH